jgi:Protein of unknown function (DUF1579)
MTQQTIDIKLQSQGQTIIPSAEHQRLDLFVGKWKTEGETRANADVPAIKVAFVDTYEWMAGKFFLVHRANGHIGNEELNTLEFISYDSSSQTYTCHCFDSRGNADLLQADFRDPMWTIEGKSSRFTGMFAISGNTLTGKWEQSSDGLNWLPCMDIKSTKVL